MAQSVVGILEMFVFWPICVAHHSILFVLLATCISSAIWLSLAKRTLVLVALPASVSPLPVWRTA